MAIRLFSNYLRLFLNMVESIFILSVNTLRGRYHLGNLPGLSSEKREGLKSVVSPIHTWNGLTNTATILKRDDN